MTNVRTRGVRSTGEARLSGRRSPRAGLVRCLRRGLVRPGGVSDVIRGTEPVVTGTGTGSTMSRFFKAFIPGRVRIGGCHGCIRRCFSFRSVDFYAVGNDGNSKGSSLFVSTVISYLCRRPERKAGAN